MKPIASLFALLLCLLGCSVNAQIFVFSTPTLLASNTVTILPPTNATQFTIAFFSMPQHIIQCQTLNFTNTNTCIVTTWLSLDGTNRIYLSQSASNSLASNGFFNLTIPAATYPVYGGLAVATTNENSTNTQFQGVLTQ